MKKRFFQLFIVCIGAVLIISTLFYFLICAGLRNVKRDAEGKLNYILKDTTYYNTVFLGSSTMHVGINPIQFDSLTGTNSFNASMDGLAITELNMFLPKYIAAHGAPKHLYINCDETTMGFSQKVWDFSQYYPYVNDPDMDGLLEREPKLLLGKYFPPAAVTYFGDPLKNLALIGLFKTGKGTKYDIPMKGFVPKAQMQKKDTTLEAFFVERDHAWQLLAETYTLCNKNKVAVTLILMPRYYYSLSRSSVPVIDKLKSVSTAFGVKVLDFTADQRFADNNLFFDRIHLDKNGAELLTSVLAKDFKASTTQ